MLLGVFFIFLSHVLARPEEFYLHLSRKRELPGSRMTPEEFDVAGTTTWLYVLGLIHEGHTQSTAKSASASAWSYEKKTLKLLSIMILFISKKYFLALVGTHPMYTLHPIH